MIVLLFEDAEGDFREYEEHLMRAGIAGRIEVELIKFSKQMTREDVIEGIHNVGTKIRNNEAETGKLTLIHAYLSAGNTRLDRQGLVEMQLACGRWYGFEKKMRRFQDRKELIVWAVLDCDRVQNEDFLYQGATDTCTEASVIAGDATTN